ncbi:MAG: hypothetical protein JWL82_62 [Parcubacteria group bacterium]|nr:hypothetical protein [Parcubacteria group bacterium]
MSSGNHQLLAFVLGVCAAILIFLWTHGVQLGWKRRHEFVTEVVVGSLLVTLFGLVLQDHHWTLYVASATVGGWVIGVIFNRLSKVGDPSTIKAVNNK